MTHEVYVLCNCEGGVEHCDMERYVSDVRIAYRALELLTKAIRAEFGKQPLASLT